MPTEVPGQFFGYSLQWPRAYLNLLKIPSDAAVSVEEFSDVSIIFSDGSKTAEEDKSSISGQNPVSDASTNLWKSFYNWVKKINDGVLDVNRDNFVLYANYEPVEKTIVNKIKNVDDKNVGQLINEIKEKLKSVKSEDVKKYVNFIFSDDNIEITRKLFVKFEFVCNKKADDVYDEIKKELKRQLCNDDEDLINYIIEQSVGWLKEKIMKSFANKECSFIFRKEYEKYIKPYVKKIIDSSIKDYSLSKILTEENKQNTLNERPVFVKQLEFIELENYEILSAIEDYYKADLNRLKWRENEIVTIEDLENFDKDLKKYYSYEKQKIDLLYSSFSNEKKGSLLYLNCQDKDIKLAQQTPPARTVQGTYQVLSNNKEIGWHPNWKEKLEDTK